MKTSGSKKPSSYLLQPAGVQRTREAQTPIWPTLAMTRPFPLHPSLPLSPPLSPTHHSQHESRGRQHRRASRDVQPHSLDRTGNSAAHHALHKQAGVRLHLICISSHRPHEIIVLIESPTRQPWDCSAATAPCVSLPPTSMVSNSTGRRVIPPSHPPAWSPPPLAVPASAPHGTCGCCQTRRQRQRPPRAGAEGDENEMR